MASSPAELESGECCEALVAADIVAGAMGAGMDRLESQGAYAKQAIAWLKEHRSSITDSDRSLARTAVERIASRSELQELWDEGGRHDEWHADLDELEKRLSESVPSMR